MPRKKDKCPNCGRDKVSTSLVCGKCAGIARRKTQFGKRRVPCPGCGKPMVIGSQTCKLCQRQPQNVGIGGEDLLSVDPLWLAEFRGLFYGEGTAMIIRNNSSYAPCIAIRLRDDDADMITQIHHKIGGRLLKSNRSRVNEKHGDQLEWRVTDMNRCRLICETLLTGLLPAKKKRDIELVRDFCDWRSGTSYYFTEDERQEAERRFLEIREVRKYPSC